MPRIKMKQVQGVGRVTLEYAIDQFMRHNRLKNLSSRTLEYYEEDLRYFQRTTAVTYLDEITDKLYEDFILHEMDKGNKMTAVNCRTRGLRVFLRFCAKREYMELIHIPIQMMILNNADFDEIIDACEKECFNFMDEAYIDLAVQLGWDAHRYVEDVLEDQANRVLSYDGETSISLRL